MSVDTETWRLEALAPGKTPLERRIPPVHWVAQNRIIELCDEVDRLQSTLNSLHEIDKLWFNKLVLKFLNRFDSKN